MLTVNMGYILAYVFSYGLGVWQCAFALAGNVYTSTIFEAKFGWTEDETIFYNTIISTAPVIGLTIGSFFAGPILSLGRRRGALVTNIIAIIGAAITMI